MACSGSRVWAKAKPEPPARNGISARAAQEYHIEVNTLPGCFFYGCRVPVRAGNIRVTAGGVRVQVLVAQPPRRVSGAAATPGVPVHLLVAFSPGTARPTDAELLVKLRRVFAAGWLVSVCRADGTFTPYANLAQLTRTLAEHADAPKADAGLDELENAIDALRAEPGYRVVMVDLGGRSDDKFVRWLASTADRLSPIYVSDGGRTQMPYSPSAEEEEDGHANPFAGAADKKERDYRDGVFHELELAEALNHAVADTRFDYDVRFRVPVSVSQDVPVKLTFLDPGTHLPFELRTDLYTVETREASGKPARLRSDATARLLTVER